MRAVWHSENDCGHRVEDVDRDSVWVGTYGRRRRHHYGRLQRRCPVGWYAAASVSASAAQGSEGRGSTAAPPAVSRSGMQQKRVRSEQRAASCRSCKSPADLKRGALPKKECG